MSKILIEYIRKPKIKNGLVVCNDPIGVVIATGPGIIGWSICNTKAGDKFNKSQGIDIALVRANSSWVMDDSSLDNYYHTVPMGYGIEEKLEKMIARSITYFKEK